MVKKRKKARQMGDCRIIFTKKKLNNLYMRKTSSIFISLVTISLIGAGCMGPGPEGKLGRGINNMGELTRMGEISRSIEQTAIFSPSPEVAYTTGFIHGFNRSLCRTFTLWCAV